MLNVTTTICLNPDEVSFQFIRSRGPGGQNVNKVASAVLLRFNIKNSSLPQFVKDKLYRSQAKKINSNGELIFKVDTYRTQQQNKKEALIRLLEMIKRAAFVEKKRKATRISLGTKERRLAKKKLHGKAKLLRQKRVNVEG